MPVLRKSSPRQLLTLPQLRILRELNDLGEEAALRRADLVARNTTVLAWLAEAGLVECATLDVEGLTERVWSITEKGREVIAGSAVPLSESGNHNGSQAITEIERPTIGALVPWFGSCRRYADTIGEACKGCIRVAIPFAGSMAEVPAILAAGVGAVAVNDLHNHLTNLARVAADAVLGPALYRVLRRQPFSQEVLSAAQIYCRKHTPKGDGSDLDAAIQYFIAAWCGRSANTGTKGEFKGSLSARWTAGGDSALRFARATYSLRAWRKILERCSITSWDVFDFLARMRDDPKNGIYADPPWPGPGEGYLHAFSEEQHVRLAQVLSAYTKTRIVVRSGGGVLTERLYPRGVWTWKLLAGRNSANKVSEEWLILHNEKRV